MGLVIIAAVAVFAVAFLIGSIPFGLVISKYVYHLDLREQGSGNIGATNAMRVLGKKAGIAVFLLDALKGVVASLIGWVAGSLLLSAPDSAFAGSDAGVFAGASAITCLAFFAVVLGHCFSPWLGWKGGKGIAAAGGGLFVVLGPIGGIVELALFGVVAVATRYASLGSLTAAWVLLPFSLLKFIVFAPAGSDPAWLAFALCAAAVLVVTWAHRENIKRLRAGTESRFGSKGK